MLTVTDKHQLEAWNGTWKEYPREASVPRLVAQQAAARPNTVALVSSNGALTYGDLNHRANQLSSLLRQLGVEREVPVVIYLDRSIDFVVALLGALKAGGAYVPIDPSYPAARTAFMLQDTQAPVVITRRELAAHLPVHQARTICLGAENILLTQQSTAEPAVVIAPEQTAYIIYTSGSTGVPKGVQITHASLMNLISWHQRAFGVTAQDKATQLAGVAFDAAVWELWPYLTIGARIALPAEEIRGAPVLLRNWLVTQGITMAFLPTALAEQLLMLEWPAQTPLRYLLTGADTLYRYPPAGLPFVLVNNYGPTECTVVATSGVVLPAQRDRPPTIGYPIQNTQIYLLDQQLRQVPLGVPGEIYIGGAGVGRGYLNRPDLTAERFIRHLFSDDPQQQLFKTGDLACLLPDGQLQFLGRVDDQMKIRGYRVEPNEIVLAMNTHPAVKSSLVLAREETPGERRLVAYIVPNVDQPLTAATLLQHLQQWVPEYMLPETFVWLPAFPLTPNGKIDRDALPVPDSVNTVPDAVEGFTNIIEDRITSIITTLLRLERVGLDENFFLLGGHSLLGTQALARISDAFGVELTLRTVFESPTVRLLAAEVERYLLEKLEAMEEHD